MKRFLVALCLAVIVLAQATSLAHTNESCSISMLKTRVIESATDTVWLIFSSNTVAPQGYAAEMDALSSQMIYGMCINHQNYGYDESGLLLGNGHPDPRIAQSGMSIVLFGGPGASKAVAYYENSTFWFSPHTFPADLAPVRMNWNSLYYWFELRNGTMVPKTAATKSTIGRHQDFILIETFVDSFNRLVFIAYGYNRYGTNLAAFYFKDVVCRNINAYMNSWCIFHWIDSDNDELLGPGEVTLVATG